MSVPEVAKPEKFPAPARRPSQLAMDCTLFEETFSTHMPEWTNALQLALGEYFKSKTT
jgi:dTDP-4-dehydrorhamnose reductase